MKGKSVEEDLETFWSATSKLREQTGKPVLSVVGFDSVEYMYGREEVSKILGRSITLVRNLEDVRLNFIRPTSLGPSPTSTSKLTKLTEPSSYAELNRGRHYTASMYSPSKEYLR